MPKTEEYEVKVIKVGLICDRCGGEMKSGGHSKPSSPPLNEHICSKCGEVEWVRGRWYPYVKYVPKTEEENHAEEADRPKSGYGSRLYKDTDEEAARLLDMFVDGDGA